MMVHRATIDMTAQQFGISPELVEAVCLVESNGRPGAWNPEPRYRWFWNVRTNTPCRAVTPAEIASKFPPSDFYDPQGWKGHDADAEWWGQQASWGLMQVMGAVAREHGFKAIDIPDLCGVPVNLLIGCRVLRGLLLWAKGDIRQAVAGYNGGRGWWRNADPQAYARKVIRMMAAVERSRSGEA